MYCFNHRHEKTGMGQKDIGQYVNCTFDKKNIYPIFAREHDAYSIIREIERTV